MCGAAFVVPELVGTLATMSTNPTPAPAKPLCCGLTEGAWVPGEGKPVALGCRLCPRSGPDWYWNPARLEREANV